MWRLSKIRTDPLARHNRDIEGTVSFAWNRKLSLIRAIGNDAHLVNNRICTFQRRCFFVELIGKRKISVLQTVFLPIPQEIKLR